MIKNKKAQKLLKYGCLKSSFVVKKGKKAGYYEIEITKMATTVYIPPEKYEEWELK